MAMTPPFSPTLLLILLIISMTVYNIKDAVLIQGACNKSSQADKNMLHDGKWICQNTKHYSSENAVLLKQEKRTLLCQEPAQPKEGLADKKHNNGNTKRIPMANSKGRRLCRETAQRGERSVQNRCPGKAESALNLTQDSIFV